MGSMRVSADAAEKETPSPWSTPISGVTHRGQGLVEFALILPVFLLLILGIIEFGRLMVTYSSISTASRDAARYAISAGDTLGGIPHYHDCLGIRAAAERVSIFAELSIVITYDADGPGGADPVEYCQVGISVDPIQVSLGSQINVAVADVYEPLVPLSGLPTIPILSDTTRTVLTGVQLN